MEQSLRITVVDNEKRQGEAKKFTLAKRYTLYEIQLKNSNVQKTFKTVKLLIKIPSILGAQNVTMF